MKKCGIWVSLILIITNIYVIAATKKDVCKKCVNIEDCPTIASLPTKKQQIWQKRFPCEIIKRNHRSGFWTDTNVDYICCPNFDILEFEQDTRKIKSGPSVYKYLKTRQRRQTQQDEIQNTNGNPVTDQMNQGNDKKSSKNPGPYYPNEQNQYDPELPPPVQIQNTQYLQVPSPAQQQNYFLNNDNGNFFGVVNSGAQCTELTSLLPDPRTGCCGQDMSETSRITDLQNILNIFAPSKLNWANQFQTFRRRRSAENKVEDNELDDRIAGGKETELDQFPWTVLLKITISFGDKQVSLNCGGSLISSKYVLTAGHCLNENRGVIIDIEITLAEYDKSQFPRDCKPGLGERNCIDNILMYAKTVILHPQYDDDTLQNDIALIELDGDAPYTQYIRPICIPPFNVDDPEFSNLPLAVAGWGRNGQFLTDIKQSTVVHLVPHDECDQSYPNLSNTQLCAAGRTGEDTCKGDSGGPLMLLYRQNYYVVGVVSGKRSDSPCGTSVPTLYTNVFHYVPWIKSVIS